jgi:hypothetical protein
MKVQPPEPLDYTRRHGYLTAQHAIRDVYDALVELITNSDIAMRKSIKQMGKF